MQKSKANSKNIAPIEIPKPAVAQAPIPRNVHERPPTTRQSAFSRRVTEMLIKFQELRESLIFLSQDLGTPEDSFLVTDAVQAMNASPIHRTLSDLCRFYLTSEPEYKPHTAEEIQDGREAHLESWYQRRSFTPDSLAAQRLDLSKEFLGIIARIKGIADDVDLASASFAELTQDKSRHLRFQQTAYRLRGIISDLGADLYRHILPSWGGDSALAYAIDELVKESLDAQVSP